MNRATSWRLRPASAYGSLPTQHGLPVPAAPLASTGGAIVSKSWSCAQCRFRARIARRPMDQDRLRLLARHPSLFKVATVRHPASSTSLSPKGSETC